jgi:hypothetical protein
MTPLSQDLIPKFNHKNDLFFKRNNSKQEAAEHSTIIIVDKLLFNNAIYRSLRWGEIQTALKHKNLLIEF